MTVPHRWSNIAQPSGFLSFSSMAIEHSGLPRSGRVRALVRRAGVMIAPAVMILLWLSASALPSAAASHDQYYTIFREDKVRRAQGP